MGSAESLKQLLSESAIPSEASSQMTGFLTLLEKWNARINLTASTEWRVIGPMFREAIWAAGFYPAEAVSHLDIGSGAGFPALLLKILHPRIQLELIESREKKSQFLETAAHHLGLRGVRVWHARLSEYLDQSPAGKRWDCVSWKALKLGTEDLRQLRTHGLSGTEFWMFHGKEPALEDRDAVRGGFEPVRTEKVPGTKESYLSIYKAVRVHSRSMFHVKH